MLSDRSPSHAEALSRDLRENFPPDMLAFRREYRHQTALDCFSYSGLECLAVLGRAPGERIDLYERGPQCRRFGHQGKVRLREDPCLKKGGSGLVITDVQEGSHRCAVYATDVSRRRLRGDQCDVPSGWGLSTPLRTRMETRTPTDQTLPIRERGRTSYSSMVTSPGSPSWLFTGAREHFRPSATVCCTRPMFGASSPSNLARGASIE
jgi:hypothetical protein